MKPETPPAGQGSAGAVPRLTIERADLGPMAKRWRRPSARTIVKLLALAPGHRLHRDEIMAVCWPEADTGSARSSLRVAVHAVRRAVEPGLAPRTPSSYLPGDGDLLYLDPRTVRVDLAAAEQLAAEALDSGDLQLLTEADRTLGAELLPEDRYAEWAAHPRRELARVRRAVVLELVDRAVATGELQHATARLEQLLEVDESDEELARALIRAYLAAGRNGPALERYHRLRTVLQQELGVTPTGETEELRLAIPAIDQPDSGAAPRPAGPAAVPAAIRRSATASFHGRTRAMSDLLAGLPGHASGSPSEPLTIVSGESGMGNEAGYARILT